MIKPITSPGATSVDVIFPGKDEVRYFTENQSKYSTEYKFYWKSKNLIDDTILAFIVVRFNREIY